MCMKPKSFLALALLLVTVSVNAQLTAKKKCDDFTVDILNGKVNEFKANTTADQLKAKFPCFTGSEEENSSSKCGGLVIFKDKDLTFFTGRDYIEIGEKFKGKLSLALMGAARNSFFKTLGHPKIKDDTWDAYQMQYGTLVLHYNKANKVRLIQISTLPTENLSLCQ
jgi:hypothetical protein